MGTSLRDWREDGVKADVRFQVYGQRIKGRLGRLLERAGKAKLEEEFTDTSKRSTVKLRHRIPLDEVQASEQVEEWTIRLLTQSRQSLQVNHRSVNEIVPPIPNEQLTISQEQPRERRLQPLMHTIHLPLAFIPTSEPTNPIPNSRPRLPSSSTNDQPIGDDRAYPGCYVYCDMIVVSQRKISL